jgi:hypothetical protein
MALQLIIKNSKDLFYSWLWWFMPVNPTFSSLRQEDSKFEASLGYTVKPCLKTKIILKISIYKIKHINNIL